ncbi:MAG: isopeptide-forming domain-containing fimbrial protein, partial [Spirulinaceae cyanobacterium]
MKLIKLGSGSFYIIALTAIISLVAGSSPAIAQPPPIENTASASGDNLPTGGVDSNLNRIVISNTITTPVNVAEPAQLELIKTADRAAAEPGDTVVYRLSLKNSGTTAVTGFTITDTMPLGLNFLSESLQGSITDGTSTTPTTLPTATSSGRTVTFTSSDTLNPGQILNVIYAAVVTPDAVRGDGRNTAQEPRSNLASYRLRIRPGILSDCGTVVGRVFVDKNFDGEQQPGESGVPNA